MSLSRDDQTAAGRLAMIRSANQPLALDEFDDFAPSLNVSDLLNGVGEDHDVVSRRFLSPFEEPTPKHFIALHITVL